MFVDVKLKIIQFELFYHWDDIWMISFAVMYSNALLYPVTI